MLLLPFGHRKNTLGGSWKSALIFSQLLC